jgi:hypothetical protein
MNHNDLIRKMHELEDELEVEYINMREEFDFIIKEKRVRFAEEVALQQSQLRSGLYFLEASRLNILSALLIFAGFIPFIMLDLFLVSYQTVCFPIYGISKVRRSEHLICDRDDIPYLNMREKFNLFYCSYGNGLAAFVREILACAEQCDARSHA